jgi:hypothetical protein
MQLESGKCFAVLSVQAQLPGIWLHSSGEGESLFKL